MTVRYIVVVDYTKVLTGIDDRVGIQMRAAYYYFSVSYDFDNNNEHVFYVFTSLLRYVCSTNYIVLKCVLSII